MLKLKSKINLISDINVKIDFLLKTNPVGHFVRADEEFSEH